MRRILVAGNWKMHGSGDMVQDFWRPARRPRNHRGPVDMAVFPPFPYLGQAQTLLRGSDIAWGAQNLNPVPQGAHTGEVSAGMLLDFGCRYVLVGHSERRTIYGESMKMSPIDSRQRWQPAWSRFCVWGNTGRT